MPVTQLRSEWTLTGKLDLNIHGHAEPRPRTLQPLRLDLSSAERADLGELLLIAQQAALESARYLSARNPGSPTIDELNRVASRAAALRERVKGN